MIQLNPQYEKIFDLRNLDDDCDKIADLMSSEASLIKEAMEADLFKQAVIMYLQLLKAMCLHFVGQRNRLTLALSPDRRFKVDYLVKAPHGGAIAIECDGLEYHANATAYQKDRQRDNLLTNHGFQVLRFSSIDIYNDLQGCINQVEDSFSNFQHGRVVYHRNGGLGYFGANI